MVDNYSSILSNSTYHIDSELGSGGGGIVYKAWHTRLQKYVVIKELKRGSANDIETQRNEVEALKNVKNAYLPQVFDFLTEGERVFTVMEFIEGESLDKLIERGNKFTQPQVVKWYGQLVSALEAIHKQNVYHRDIKPANIMLTSNGDVCLIDFNAALVSGNDVRLISRSLGYASPEQYEIYERFKKSHKAPINYGSSSIAAEPLTGIATELISDDSKTELIEDDSTHTELKSDTQKTELIVLPATDSIDWRRSDIYSLGATMYHLLTGQHPPERAAEVITISKLGRFSEGLVYIIEQSMQIKPSERFPSVTFLADAVLNIHKHDTRWKVSQSKKIAAAIILPLAFVLFAAAAFMGRNVMAQEKEERYYTAVHNIEKGTDIESEYTDALAMFTDRIDPYRAMAKRLWDNGDMDACQKYIEENLGNIAKFQTIPEAEQGYGDIYYILGNCYYYQTEKPDYETAKGYFEIALKFVKDNSAYYRDYAVTLARTGNVTDAESVLEKAKELNLDIDSLNMLNGEIDFVKQDYESAIDNFSKVTSLTSDDYLRYRAYHTSDEIFKRLGKPERSVELLSEAVKRIPLNRIPEMTERLADAYAKSGDYTNAIALFEKLSESGSPKFNIMQNLAILLQKIGKFDRAGTELKKMGDAFPDDYRIPMRQALLEADRQSKIDNKKRDYKLTKKYYDAAIDLYKSNVKPGESDPEMQQLDVLIDQLRQYKWIN